MHRRVNPYLVALMVALATITSFGQTAQPPAYPQIIVRVNLTGQTNEIPTTQMFTPDKDGLFRICGAMVITAASNQPGSWLMSFTFVSDGGSETESIFGQNSQVVGGGGGDCIPFRSNARIPVTYFVQSNGNPQGSVYELFFVVERLE